MSLSLPDIDNRIAGLNAQIESMADSLLDLDSDVTLKLLTSAKLRGRTAEEWAAVSPKLPLLWSYFGVLKDRTALLASKRAQPRLSREAIDELSTLLLAETVPVPPDPAAPAARSLSPAVNTMAIDALQAAMERMFGEVVSLVDRVGSAWEALPRLDAAADKLTGLTQLAGQNGLKPPAEIVSARSRITSLKEQLQSDPLSAGVSGVDGVERQASSAEEVLRTALAARGELTARLEASAQALQAIDATIGEARTFGDEAAVKIAGTRGNAEIVQRLTDGLERFRSNLNNLTTLARSNWQESVRLLAHLDQQVASLQADSAAALAAVRGPLDARNQLRGLLDAYKAKALAKGRGEDAALAGIYDRAHKLLFTAPCELAKAEAAVREYQESLNHPSRV